MTRISLVTGAAGFIGSHVCDELLSRGHSVVGLDDLSGGFRDQVPREVRFVEGSVEDEALVARLFAGDRFTHVYHCAAYAAEGLSHFIKGFNYRNNLLGSVNLINASVNAGTVECFVFTSSIAVYGHGQVPMTEDMTPRPEDPYGIAKHAVELDLHESHRMFGLNFVIVRPHNVFGERQNLGDPYRNVIGIFMNRILQGLPMTVFGDGRQTRAFTYISDVAPVIAEAGMRREAWNEVYNVGADAPHTVLELAGIVARAMGVDPRIEFLPVRDEVVHAFSSHEKARRAFEGLVRNVPLEEGVSRMARWARTAGARAGKPFTRIEVQKNMPPSWRRLLAP